MGNNNNKKLKVAKERKNDEFYTLLEEVKKELNYAEYWEQLRGRHILFPCDKNFEELNADKKEEFFKTGMVQGENDNFAFSRYFNDKKEEYNLKLHFSNFNIDKQVGVHFREAINKFSKEYVGGGCYY